MCGRMVCWCESLWNRLHMSGLLLQGGNTNLGQTELVPCLILICFLIYSFPARKDIRNWNFVIYNPFTKLSSLSSIPMFLPSALVRTQPESSPTIPEPKQSDYSLSKNYTSCLVSGCTIRTDVHPISPEDYLHTYM